jgi:hypothetical protein
LNSTRKSNSLPKIRRQHCIVQLAQIRLDVAQSEQKR